MRRLVLGSAVVAGLAGCGGDAFKGNPDTVARVGEATLSAQQLATFLSSGKGIQLNDEAADFVKNVWVDYTLFAQAAAKGNKLTDSATIAEAMWPQLTELKATLWHDTLMARRLDIPASDVQAAYDNGENRLFQHILVRVTPGGTPEEKAGARRKAQQALTAVKGGANFARVASKESQDPGSARDSGYLPPGPAGRFVPQFDSAAWKLAPGAMSGIVETPFGFHIIRRPSFDEVRDRYEAFIGQGKAATLDSIYMDSLGLLRKLKVLPGAPALMKEAIAHPDKFAKSEKALGEYTGGKLTVSQYLRWVRVLPPQITGQLKSAPDSVLTRFATNLGTNLLLISQADSAGIRVSADQWAAITQSFTAQVDSLENDLGLAGIADSTASERERLKAAGLKVDNYFQGVISGQVRMRPVPGSLGMVLRDRSRVSFSGQGTKKALEIARAAQMKDSAATAAAGAAPKTPGAPVPDSAQPAGN